MKERKKPVWYSILIYILLFSVAGLVLYFVISSVVGVQYTSISTNSAITLVYETKDTNNYVVYKTDASTADGDTTVYLSVGHKATSGAYTNEYYTFKMLSDDFNKTIYKSDTSEHSGKSFNVALNEEVEEAKTLYTTDDNFKQLIGNDTKRISYDSTPYVQNWFVSWLPTILIFVAFVVIGFVFFRMLMGSGNANSKAMDFNKSTARRVDDSKVRFGDVAGCDEEKAEMAELVDYLKEPKKYTKNGATLPKGVLLVGPPGTGKTLLAKAVAGEAGVPFFSISGSDFVEMFVGVGAGRVRDLFKTAKQNAPCIVFIDEIDAVGRQRGAGMGGGNDEREQTLNQLLVELDGFEANSGILVIAATNRSDVLDPALLRAGRFDRQITVNLPDRKGREAIFKVHAKNKTIDPSIDFLLLAKRTVGFSGADIANILNEAAILAVRAHRDIIVMADIDEAIDRRIAGPAKSSKGMSEKERQIVAYHESGHAIIGLTLPNADKVRKITIIPRGTTGGHVLMGPEDDRFLLTKGELTAEIVGLLGGRSSEEVFFDDTTTGASNDIERATQIARSMVVEYGMSSLGPIQYEKDTGSVFLGRDYNNSQKNFSIAVADEIDKEVRKIIEEAHNQAIEIINKRKEDVILIATTLLEFETINEEQIDYLLKNRKMPDGVTQKDSALSSFTKENQARISSDDTILGEEKKEEKPSTAKADEKAKSPANTPSNDSKDDKKDVENKEEK